MLKVTASSFGWCFVFWCRVAVDVLVFRFFVSFHSSSRRFGFVLPFRSSDVWFSIPLSFLRLFFVSSCPGVNISTLGDLTSSSWFSFDCFVVFRFGLVPSFRLFRFGSFVSFYSYWYHTTGVRSSCRFGFGSVISVLFLSVLSWPVIFVTSVRTRCPFLSGTIYSWKIIIIVSMDSVRSAAGIACGNFP